ncbi:MAG: fibrinogen-like YCDxxxxGGGW domain-containing protein, partial [Myxococcota bacterium]|nr:fibrinogen-like YCDxxxxGGGW domain-containing protein [Myxococcota bacterium]
VTYGESFTVELWANVTEMPEEWTYIFNHGWTPQLINFQMTPDIIKFRVDLAYFYEIPNTLVLGEWTHLALVVDQGQATMYIHGQPKLVTNTQTGQTSMSYPVESPSDEDAQQPVNFGGFDLGPEDYPFNGYIQRVRISNTAKYLTNFTPSPTLSAEEDTVGFWPLYDESTTTAADEGPGGYDGSVIGPSPVADCPSATSTGVCGDGVTQDGEQCDDGGAQSGDGCSPTCTLVSQGGDCLEILNDDPAAPDGVYTIDPDGTGPIEVECDMTTSGGGWTQLTDAYRQRLAVHDRAYLYEREGAWYRSPETTLVWDWETFQLLEGDYSYAATPTGEEQSFSCTSGEITANNIGIGCSTGTSSSFKVVCDEPLAPGCTIPGPLTDPGKTCVCQNQPNIFGSPEACIDNVQIYERAIHGDADGDGVSSLTDCDDGDPDIYPLAGDTYGDDVDSDCDGLDCNGWQDPHTDIYYVVCFDPMLTWFDARDTCLSMGGDLASIHSEAVNEQLNEMANVNPEIKGMYIGLHYVDDAWVWTDGT